MQLGAYVFVVVNFRQMFAYHSMLIYSYQYLWNKINTCCFFFKFVNVRELRAKNRNIERNSVDVRRSTAFAVVFSTKKK